ncbi:MerR family transcriptional regulator [Actinomadura opuntiae]|uniref:MerR family transcriptional regulator n=1 Tax=Actinomadura sp. OS1-43 TaxID=604315 RepID=UPI00255B0CF4|nr:MerR family transcriptional regulator [Actinomadura sp. OS1-43]MDL4814903.1 MerR family transcriptional regulator [Actinomadura sp. OS1-43]
MKSSATMGIGEVAGRFALATHVLRHWESVGLLNPERAAGDRRRYRSGDLYRIAVILRAKQAGLGLEEIRGVLATEDAGERREILHRQRDALAERTARARAALDVIECALACDHEDIAECRHFQAAIAAQMEEPRAVRPGARHA